LVDVPWVNSAERRAQLKALRARMPRLEDTTSLALGSSLNLAIEQSEHFEDRESYMREYLKRWRERQKEKLKALFDDPEKPVPGMPEKKPSPGMPASRSGEKQDGIRDS
jgi:hypothetical protein